MATITKRASGWQVKIRRRGYPSQSGTFDTRAWAEAWARKIESEMDDGRFVSRTEAEATTLAEALDRYAMEITPRKKPSTIAREKTVSRSCAPRRFLRGFWLVFADLISRLSYAPVSLKVWAPMRSGWTLRYSRMSLPLPDLFGVWSRWQIRSNVSADTGPSCPKVVTAVSSATSKPASWRLLPPMVARSVRSCAIHKPSALQQNWWV